MAWALRAAGHEVRISSIPSLGEDIVHTGLPAVLAGSGPRSLGVDVDGVAAAEYLQPPWPRDYAAHMHLLNEEQRGLLRSLGQYMVWAAEASVDELLAFQDRVVRRDQALERGMTAAGIKHRLMREHWQLLLPSVYLAHGGDPEVAGPFPQPSNDSLFEQGEVDSGRGIRLR